MWPWFNHSSCSLCLQSSLDCTVEINYMLWRVTTLPSIVYLDCLRGSKGRARNDLIIHYDSLTHNQWEQTDKCVLKFSAGKERRRDESCVEEGSILLQLIRSLLPPVRLQKVNSEFNGCNSGATVRLNTSNVFLRPSFTPPNTTGVDSTRPTWVNFSFI